MGLFLNFRYKYNETYHKWSSLRDFTAKLELKNNWHGNNSKFCIQRSIQISLKFTSDFNTWYNRKKMGCTNSKKNSLDQYDTTDYPDIINKSNFIC